MTILILIMEHVIKLCNNETQGGELGNGRGVVFSTGIGDGSYPVYAYLGEIDGFGERVLKVEIDFNEHVLLK